MVSLELCVRHPLSHLSLRGRGNLLCDYQRRAVQRESRVGRRDRGLYRKGGRGAVSGKKAGQKPVGRLRIRYRWPVTDPNGSSPFLKGCSRFYIRADRSKRKAAQDGYGHFVSVGIYYKNHCSWFAFQIERSQTPCRRVCKIEKNPSAAFAMPSCMVGTALAA